MGDSPRATNAAAAAENLAATFQRIQALREEGHSLREMADILTAEGYPPLPRSRKWNHMAGRRCLQQLALHPPITPLSPDQEASIQDQLAALRQDVALLPIITTTALTRCLWHILAPFIVGIVAGCITVVVTMLTALHTTTDQLDIRRDLWDVATEAEREQLVTILYRSDASLYQIYELTGSTPRLLDYSPVDPLPPPAITPPPELVEPPPPRPTHPFADTP